jgi:hypothetical protein
VTLVNFESIIAAKELLGRYVWCRHKGKTFAMSLVLIMDGLLGGVLKFDELSRHLSIKESIRLLQLCE